MSIEFTGEVDEQAVIDVVVESSDFTYAVRQVVEDEGLAGLSQYEVQDFAEGAAQDVRYDLEVAIGDLESRVEDLENAEAVEVDGLTDRVSELERKLEQVARAFKSEFLVDVPQPVTQVTVKEKAVLDAAKQWATEYVASGFSYDGASPDTHLNLQKAVANLGI